MSGEVLSLGHLSANHPSLLCHPDLSPKCLASLASIPPSFYPITILTPELAFLSHQKHKKTP